MSKDDADTDKKNTPPKATMPLKPAPVKASPPAKPIRPFIPRETVKTDQEKAQEAKQNHQHKLENSTIAVTNFNSITNPSLYKNGYEQTVAAEANKIWRNELKKNNVDLQNLGNFKANELNSLNSAIENTSKRLKTDLDKNVNKAISGYIEAELMKSGADFSNINDKKQKRVSSQNIDNINNKITAATAKIDQNLGIKGSSVKEFSDKITNIFKDGKYLVRNNNPNFSKLFLADMQTKVNDVNQSSKPIKQEVEAANKTSIVTEIKDELNSPTKTPKNNIKPIVIEEKPIIKAQPPAKPIIAYRPPAIKPRTQNITQEKTKSEITVKSENTQQAENNKLDSPQVAPKPLRAEFKPVTDINNKTLKSLTSKNLKVKESIKHMVDKISKTMQKYVITQKNEASKNRSSVIAPTLTPKNPNAIQTNKSKTIR